jgi:predicted ATP-grasp superfamily ATP-dependent carboligase
VTGGAARRAAAVVVDLNKTGCAVVRCLGRAGVAVTGVHAVPYPALGARSRYASDPVVVPNATSRELLAAFEALADRLGAMPVVVCATDQAIDFCSRHRAALALRYHLPGARAAALHELLDKGTQAELAERAGLRVPPTVVVRRGEPLDDARLAAVGLPAIVKPASSLFGYKRFMGIERTRTALGARIARTLEQCPAVVVSRYVSGDARANFTVMVLGRRDGTALVAAVTRKLRLTPSPAFGAGTLVETCRDDELEALAAAFVREAGLTGPAELEFKREDGAGPAWFIEANLRCSALVGMTPAAGANLPLCAYLDALGLPLPVRGAGAAVTWVDELRDWGACAAQGVSRAAMLRDYDRVSLLSLYADDDPEPFTAALRDARADAGEDELFALALERLVPPRRPAAVLAS